MIKILVRDENGNVVHETTYDEDYGSPSDHAINIFQEVFGNIEAFTEISENAPQRWYAEDGKDVVWYEDND